MKYSFTSSEKLNLLELLSDKIGGVSLNSFKQLLKNREIKINGSRVTENVRLSPGDTVEIFVPAAFIRTGVSVVYEDENILVADKPEFTTVEGGLIQLLKDKYPYIAPAHRLDRNTRGLVIFAKNKIAEEILFAAFKQRSLEKKYRALVKGTPSPGVYKAYLFKDAEKSVSYVSDTVKPGYKEIATGINNVKSYGRISDIELTLITGRTHQLRAHLSHIGYPILGDDKYGDRAFNKLSDAKIQELIAVSIEFSGLSAPLDYLNGKKICSGFEFDMKYFKE